MTEKIERGLVQVYTGNGKGKTTASLGLALRAAGHGLKTIIIQFMKGDESYGEIKALRTHLSKFITIKQTGQCSFVEKGNPSLDDIRLAREGIELARQAISGKDYDIVILDEINCALDFSLVKLSDVLELIRKKPANMELVLTGRDACKEVIDAADLVTEMKEVKHYYVKQKIPARKGIEW